MARYERACAAVLRDNAILMVYLDHGEHQHWSLPGGGIEPGESPADAALRELAEETGLRGTRPVLLFERPWGREQKGDIEYCFLVNVSRDQEPALPDGEQSRREREDLAAAAWRPLDEVRHDRQVARVLAALGEPEGS